MLRRTEREIWGTMKCMKCMRSKRYEMYEVYKREEKRRAWVGASTCLITSLDIVLLPRSFGCG